LFIIGYQYNSKTKKTKTKQKISCDLLLNTAPKTKEIAQMPINKENSKKDNELKQRNLKSTLAKKPEFFTENLLHKNESLKNKRNVIKEKPLEKNKKTITFHQKNNFLTQKEVINPTNETNIILQTLSKRTTQSKSPFSRTEKPPLHKKKLPLKSKNAKNVSKKNKVFEKTEIKTYEEHKTDEKYNQNQMKFRSKRSKSSMIIEIIEEEIFLDEPKTLNKNNSFITALKNQGTFEVNNFNLEDDYIEKKEDGEIQEVLNAKNMRNQQEIIEIKEENNSVFDKEMMKFFENTFKRQETPPFTKGRRNSEKNIEYKERLSKDCLLYDPILQQYYDKNANVYFELL